MLKTKERTEKVGEYICEITSRELSIRTNVPMLTHDITFV